MHSLGNDFMVIDACSQTVVLSTATIQQWADRHRGIGFDQLLLLEPPQQPDADFTYRIFNADGQEVNQCGNGACCIAHFIQAQQLSATTTLQLATRNRLIMVENLDAQHARANMGVPALQPEAIPFITEKTAQDYQLNRYHFQVVNMGNPHAIIQVTDLNQIDINTVGQTLSTHPAFPEGTNVSFMHILDPQNINLRVYERGVGQTQACGSGACAAVVAGRLTDSLADSVTVNLPGGKLTVSWQAPAKPVYLTSPVAIVYQGHLQHTETVKKS